MKTSSGMEAAAGLPPSPTMSVVDYGRRVGIGRDKMRQLAASDGFPSIYVGRKILVLVREADNWLASRAGQRI